MYFSDFQSDPGGFRVWIFWQKLYIWITLDMFFITINKIWFFTNQKFWADLARVWLTPHQLKLEFQLPFDGGTGGPLDPVFWWRLGRARWCPSLSCLIMGKVGVTKTSRPRVSLLSQVELWPVSLNAFLQLFWSRMCLDSFSFILGAKYLVPYPGGATHPESIRPR